MLVPFWAVCEFATGQLFGSTRMKSGRPDTLGDLMVDAVGAALAALAGVLYLYDDAGRGLRAPFDLFIETNRSRFRKILKRRR